MKMEMGFCGFSWSRAVVLITGANLTMLAVIQLVTAVAHGSIDSGYGAVLVRSVLAKRIESFSFL